VVQGRTTSELALGSRFIDTHRELRLAHLVRSHWRVTVAQIAENVMLPMIEMCQNTQCIVEYLSYNFHCDVLQNWILRQSCLHLAIAHTFHLISYGPAPRQMLFSLFGCYSRYALLDLFAFLQLRESTQTLLKRVGKIPRRNCKICSKGCSGGHQCVYFRCDCWKGLADQRGKKCGNTLYYNSQTNYTVRFCNYSVLSCR